MEKEQEFGEGSRSGVAAALACRRDTWVSRDCSGASGRVLPQSHCRRSFAYPRNSS